MSIYPQIGSGTLGSPTGLAERIRDLERYVKAGNAVRTEIGPGGITTGLIGTSAIVTSHISSGTINADHIQTLAINAGHMQADSITVANAALANAVVTSAKINDLAVIEAKIGNLAVTAAKIGNLAVQTAKIDDLAVTTAKIGLLAVDVAQIKDAAITTAKIGDLQVTNAKVGNLSADKITSGTLDVNLLAATTAVADTLLSRLITAGSLVATNGLSAVSANMGTLTSGKIIVGSAGAQKTAIGSNISTSAGTKSGIVGTNASNVITFHLDNTTGDLILKGSILTGSTGLGNLDGKVYNTTDPLFTTNPSGGVALVVDAITAREMNVGTLSAITADMGTLTAGRISGGTIAGNVIDAGSITASQINVSYGGTQKLNNSNFNAGITGWTSADGVLGGPAYDASVPGGGYVSMIPGSAGLNPYVMPAEVPLNLTPGSKVSASGHFVRTGATKTAVLGVQFFDASHAFISVQTATNVAPPSGVWFRITAPGLTVPAGAQYARVYLQFATADAGQTFYFAAPKLEEGEVATLWSRTPAELGTSEVTTTTIAPGAITTSKLTATAIDGMTITGAVLRTSASNPRVEVDTTGLKKYDSSGNASVVLGTADGLDLLAATTTSPPTDRELRWLRGDGSVAGMLHTIATGLGGGEEGRLTLVSRQATSGTGTNQTVIEAQNSAGVVKADLKVYYIPNTDRGWIQADAGAYFVTLINGDNQSTFVKNPEGTVNRLMRGGSTSITGNGTSQTSITVNHNLGTTPASAVATADSGSLNLAVTTLTSTQITIVARQTDNAAWSSTFTLYWMVWG